MGFSGCHQFLCQRHLCRREPPYSATTWLGTLPVPLVPPRPPSLKPPAETSAGSDTSRPEKAFGLVLLAASPLSDYEKRTKVTVFTIPGPVHSPSDARHFGRDGHGLIHNAILAPATGTSPPKVTVRILLPPRLVSLSPYRPLIRQSRLSRAASGHA